MHVVPCCFSPTQCSTRVPVQAVEMLRLWNMPQQILVGTPLIWVKTRRLIWISEKFTGDESPSFYNVHGLFGVFFHKDVEQETGCYLMLSYSHGVSCNDLKSIRWQHKHAFGKECCWFLCWKYQCLPSTEEILLLALLLIILLLLTFCFFWPRASPHQRSSCHHAK